MLVSHAFPQAGHVRWYLKARGGFARRRSRRAQTLPINFYAFGSVLRGDSTFVTYIVTPNKENVSLSQNCGWHIHSASLNLISVLQRMCPKQLRLMRKGCLCCVLLHYQCNSSHKSFTWDCSQTCVSLLVMPSKSCCHFMQQHVIEPITSAML